MKSMLGLAGAALIAMAVAGCGGGGVGGGSQMVDGMSPVGTVDLSAFQAAYIGSGQAGSGTLFFGGRSYPFTVGGVGVGGIGASTIEAAGDVYNLQNPLQFAGSYAQGRYGFAVGDMSGGDLWLRNENGVVLHLRAKRTGLMLSLGGDVVVITMEGAGSPKRGY